MIVHGSTVALDGRGVLITGPSGAGKSALALALMAMGAGLVADDRSELTAVAGGVCADAPASLRGLIEARHIGILQAEAVGPVSLQLVVELAQAADPARLPPERTVSLLGVNLPLIVARWAPELAPAVRQFLIGGRRA